MAVQAPVETEAWSRNPGLSRRAGVGSPSCWDEGLGCCAPTPTAPHCPPVAKGPAAGQLGRAL